MSTLTISGDLSFETVPQWWASLQAQFNSSELDLELSQVARADSAGLALLVAALSEAQKRRCTMQMKGAPAQLRQLARVSGVDHLLPFVGA